MIGFDIFNNSAFSATSLTGYVNRRPYKPEFLGDLDRRFGLFTQMPSRTEDIFVERKNGTLTLIPTTERGTDPFKRQKNKRDVTSFRTVRLAQESQIQAREIQGIRAEGRENELKSVQQEVSMRMDELMDDLELTKEYHRLGALQGLVLDADGTSVIEDFYDKFDIVRPAAFNLELNVATTQVRNRIDDLRRQMMVASKGAITNRTPVHALAGNALYDALKTHPNVEKFYLNWTAAQELRNDGEAYGTFFFGGVFWHNYRGTDQASPLAIAPNEAKLFPVGAREMFKVAYAPSESYDQVNTLGQPFYASVYPDLKKKHYIDVEVMSYPLFMCQRPEALLTAVAS